MPCLRLPIVAASAVLAAGLAYSSASRAQDAAPGCSSDVVQISSCRIFPNFRACTRPQAERWLKECGDTGSFPVEEAFNPLPEGTISTQSVPAGAENSGKQDVVFWMSIGPDPAAKKPAPAPSPQTSSPPTPIGSGSAPLPTLSPAPLATLSPTPSLSPSPTSSVAGLPPSGSTGDGSGSTGSGGIGWLVLGAGLLGAAGAAFGIGKWLARPLLPDVDCRLAAGETRIAGLDPGSLGAPPVEIAVEIAPGNCTTSPYDIETLESGDD